MATLLTPRRTAALHRLDLTYGPVGATASAGAPPGFSSLCHSRVLTNVDFEVASELVMTWQILERAGLRVAASSPRAEVGTVLEMRLGLGPASLRIPCRVVYTIEETDRIGFAYGTLPGHPEAGEELFVVERSGDELSMTVRAFSRPGRRATALAGPVGRWMQHLMAGRYLRAVDRG